MAQSSERVEVLIPGEPSEGDPWADLSLEFNDGTPTVAEGVIVALHDDGTANVTLGTERPITKRIPEGTGLNEYRRLSDVTHDAMRALGQQVNTWTTDPDPGVAKIAQAIKAAVTNEGRAAVLIDLVQVVNTSGNVDLRRMAAMLVAVMIAHEGVEV